jgi:hypothetical protein
MIRGSVSLSAYGFDIDGTITADPGAYRNLMRSLMMRPYNRVHVITSAFPHYAPDLATPAGRQLQLDRLGIKAGKHYDTLDVCIGADRHEIGRKKAETCHRYDVEMMFENDRVFAEEISRVCQVVLMVPRS